MCLHRSYVFLLAALLAACSTDRWERVDRSLNEIRTVHAEQTNQLEELGTQLRAIRGRVEELEYTQNKKFGGEVDSLKNQLSTLKRRVPPPAIVPASVLDDDETLVQSLDPDIGSRFSTALQHIREGSFSDAVPILQSVLDASIGRDYSANVLLWLGVSYDGLNDHRNALLAYNQIVSTFPKHRLVPIALYRQGNVLARAGDSKTAKVIYQKLVQDYPRSAEASFARDKLKSL